MAVEFYICGSAGRSALPGVGTDRRACIATSAELQQQQHLCQGVWHLDTATWRSNMLHKLTVVLVSQAPTIAAHTWANEPSDPVCRPHANLSGVSFCNMVRLAQPTRAPPDLHERTSSLTHCHHVVVSFTLDRAQRQLRAKFDRHRWLCS